MIKSKSGALNLSATDLSNYLACKHLTVTDKALAEGSLSAKPWYDPKVKALIERGQDHENACIEHLRNSGLTVVDLSHQNIETTPSETLDVMKSGVDVIVQSSLVSDKWRGRADILLKVAQNSALGDWSYEVIDTKLAQETRCGTILQLCFYSELIAELQGTAPEKMYVVKPGENFEKEPFRLADFQAYYRLVKTQFVYAINQDQLDTYPNPVSHCEICKWWKECDTKRRADDHLSLVAGIRSGQIKELNRQGIHTLQQFGDRTTALNEKPETGSPEAYARIHDQARIQLKGRNENKLLYELLPATDGLGLQRLPAPSPGDIFFDFEADPFVENGGLEYLLGYVALDEGGKFNYHPLWAFERASEKQLFETFIDFLMARWQEYPNMYIYHFSPYEPAAVRRLTLRYATRGIEVDQLLRAERFLDLHAITKQGLRASVESYSLKELEPFYNFTRGVELRNARNALRRLEYSLEFGDHAAVDDEDKRTVEKYNRDDCYSTLALRNWLEERRVELEDAGTSLQRPEVKTGEANETVTEKQTERARVFEQLKLLLPEERSEWSRNEHAIWLLAHLIDYFDREEKCAWWEYFRLHELDVDELLDERKALTGLTFEKECDKVARSVVHRYTFPDQECTLEYGDEIHEVMGEKIGTVHTINYSLRFLDIKKTRNSVATHPTSVFVNKVIRPFPLDHSLLALARSIAGHGIDGTGPFQAARDLLLKNPPRLSDPTDGALRQENEQTLGAAIRLASNLDCSILPIQGPPGTGKTYTGAHMIAVLIDSGKKVGVTAVGHKVIRNLLEKSIEVAVKKGFKLEAIHKDRSKSEELPEGLKVESDNGKALAALDEGKVVGGTAWLWARDDAVESLDYLIVDEAGQMSLAHVLAAGRSAKNIILLGDPQQLDQPQRGAHPEGAEVAALFHILDGRQTIPDDKGLFLDVTWRLSPALCRFTSELYYENRLQALPELQNQTLTGVQHFAGSGLFYVPVEHECNQNRSDEEVAAIEKTVSLLVENGGVWTDKEGKGKALTREDIMIVAPYNAQVGALSNRLPGLEIGTVDKFQGREAPIVIYSMASSSAEDAPRGMSFLFDPNRLNVALSRALCAFILVGSPKLFEPDCRTPEQMRWANGMCRFRELARVVAL